jgi:hypothetical protein
VSDQVSHPYKTAGKTVVLYILILITLDSQLEDKAFRTERTASIAWLQSAAVFLLNAILIC